MFPKTKRFGECTLFLLIAVLPLSGFFVFTTSAVPAPPTNIHLTWQNDTSTTITVTWQTSTNTSGDIVKYDNVSRGGVPNDYLYNATGINYTYSGASGYIHDVELTGLTPDTVYYFICGGDTGGWSSERAFRTAPSVSSDVRFVAGGDSRTNIAERVKVSKAMAKFNPSFIVHTGDLVDAGEVQSYWDTWFADVRDNWICNNSELDNYGLTIPFMPIEGNHEHPQYSDTKYYNQFALPRVPSDSHGERWFSLDWGPDIHITFLTTEWNYPSEQDAWLEADLAAHKDTLWKIVAFHRPPFPGYIGRTGEAVIRERWCPLFDKYHVDMVILGHDHMYLRTCPINMSTYVQPPSSGTPAPIQNGTFYVISGGWGAPLYTPGQHWYDAYVKSIYHFCLVEIFKNGSLHLQAKDNQGNTFDEAWIIKNYSLPLPEMSIDLTEPSGYSPLPVELKWSSTGIIDHYEVYVDGQFKKYLASMTKSYRLTDATDGNHTVVVYAYDPLVKSANDSMIFSVDNTASTIGIPSRTPEGDILPDQTVKVSVNVTDTVSGVKNVTLSYTVNNGTSWTNLTMNLNSSTGLYEATIPGQPAETWVKFKIISYDNAENPAIKDGTQPYCMYQVIPEFSSALILPLLMALTIIAVISAKRKKLYL